MYQKARGGGESWRALGLRTITSNSSALRLNFGREGQCIISSYNCPILASEPKHAGDKRRCSEDRSTIWPTVRGEGIMYHDVLVCQSCHNRAPQTGSWNNRNLLIPSYGGWGRFLLRSVREGLFQGILSGLQMTMFSLRLLTRSSFCVCLSLCANFSFSQGYQSYWIGTQQITSF